MSDLITRVGSSLGTVPTERSYSMPSTGSGSTTRLNLWKNNVKSGGGGGRALLSDPPSLSHHSLVLPHQLPIFVRSSAITHP